MYKDIHPDEVMEESHSIHLSDHQCDGQVVPHFAGSAGGKGGHGRPHAVAPQGVALPKVQAVAGVVLSRHPIV